MADWEVSVVRTGLANLASVLAGFRRVGAKPHITENPGEIEKAPYVVLPGVGAFEAAMKHLNEHELTDPIRERIHAGRPTMSVCLGHQLLCQDSEEDPGVEGLGILPITVRRFPNSVRVPQLGWNKLVVEGEANVLRSGYAYFANSFCLTEAPEEWTCGFAEHGVKFVGAMEKGALLSCQFHPELSGEWGLELLKRWLTFAEGGAA